MFNMLSFDPITVYTALFILFWLLRYVRLVVNTIAYLCFTSPPLHDFSCFKMSDVTFVMPTTFASPEEVMECLARIKTCIPGAITVVTSNEKTQSVLDHCLYRGICGVQVLGVSKLNKRRQMLKGLEHVTTDITFFVDDDVLYPSTNLPKNLLHCFDDPTVGAAGPCQRARREESPSIWNFLGICYLERRNFNTGATNCIDGGISTLSGRTQAIRTAILKNKEFYNYFRNDSFLGRKLTVDDDKALTRFIYSRGWNISLNFHEECTLETTFEEGKKFIEQCIRWARGHWRGNLIVMAKESYWYKKHIWTLYAVYLSQFQTPALLVDGSLLWLLGGCYTDQTGKKQAFICLCAWICFTKLVKITPHLLRHPRDLIFVPVSIIFSYVHGFINLYALFTTHKTIWGGKTLIADETAPEDAYTPNDLPEFAARPGVNMIVREQQDVQEVTELAGLEGGGMESPLLGKAMLAQLIVTEVMDGYEE